MSSYRPRETKRGRLKLSRNVGRLYKDGNCRECSVVVTRMDFAKILGKFTKVKIQYESSTPKSKLVNAQDEITPNNARLKRNENGMVLIHRTAYNKHPAKEIHSSKKQKDSKLFNNTSPRQPSNVLKENNRLKKTPLLKDKNSNYNKKNKFSNYTKQYAIIFQSPMSAHKEKKNEVSLTELLPVIDKTILPSEEWDIDYFPKDDDPRGDQVYDRIAAELEDLMYSTKADTEDKQGFTENKGDDFPSIMDILNEKPSETKTEKVKDQTVANSELKTNLESSDVEAMLLGESGANKSLEPIPMDVENSDADKLIDDVEQLNEKPSTEINVHQTTDYDNECPSVLDKDLQKDVEHLSDKPCDDNTSENSMNTNIESKTTHEQNNDTENTKTNLLNPTDENNLNKKDIAMGKREQLVTKNETPVINMTKVSHIVFKQMKNGSCYRSVICPKSLKYSIELEGKSVELLGAPKFISSLEDLQVLLQIVNESGLSSFYVLH